MAVSYRAVTVVVCGVFFFGTTGESLAASRGRAMVSGKNVAVVACAKNNQAADYVSTVQAHLESIVARHNDGVVLDQEQAKKMKADWQQLEDPDYFVTDEDFAKQAAKYDIDTLVRAHVLAESFKGLADYYSATAHVTLRCIGPDAKVSSATSAPMGSPGCAPSDGLTKTSAAVNAVQRATDDVAQRVGLRVIPVSHQVVPLDIEGPLRDFDVVVSMPKGDPMNDTQLQHLAELENKTWLKEKVTCIAKAPGGELAAVAGHLIDIDRHRRPMRLEGSRIHLIDLKEKRQRNIFECAPVKKKRNERGTKKVLDTVFLSSWRFLAACTGNHIHLWDTERGKEICKKNLAAPIKEGRLVLAKDAKDAYLVVFSGDGGTHPYRIRVLE